MSDVDDNEVAAYLPGFGKQAAQKVDLEARYAQFARSEFAERQQKRGMKDKGDDSDDDNSDDDSDEELDELPTTHQLPFKGHTGAVRSISVDKSGTRFVSASSDNEVRFWDFNGMDPEQFSSFLAIEPVETHPVKQALFSPDGAQVLVIPVYTKPKLYTRDGAEVGEATAGDMYLVDQKKTKGHVSSMSTAAWNPQAHRMFATGATDSTVRLWDTKDLARQKSVMVLRDQGAQVKSVVNSLAWSLDGKFIYAGTSGGNITAWDTKGAMLRPAMTLKAHNGSVEQLCLLADNLLVTRGGDEDATLKVWDIRNTQTPVLQRENFSGTCNLSLSPDAQYLATGCGETLHILDKTDMSTVQQLPMGFEITAVNWDASTNQIFVGLRNGTICGLLNREHSKRGMKIVLGKAPRVRHTDDNIQTANIQAMGLSDQSYQASVNEQKQRRERQHQRRAAAAKNDAANQAKDGREGELPVDVLDNTQDPREALLKYADRAKSERLGYLNAYEDQPKIMRESAADDKDEDDEGNDEYADARRKKRLKVGR